MEPGSELHFALLGATWGFNMLRGKDFADLMAYSKAVWAAARTAEPADGMRNALDIRIAQGWVLNGKAVPVLYTDSINGRQVMRDDVWLATTDALKGEAAALSAPAQDAQAEPDPHGTRYQCERAALALGHLSDDELANGAFMNYDAKLDIARVLADEPDYHPPIVWMTAVKDRIRWLSRQLAAPAPVDAAATVPDLRERLAEAHDASLDTDHHACRAILMEIIRLLDTTPPAAPQAQAEHVQAVIEAARNWCDERGPQDWSEAELMKAIATLDGDWPGCEGCDFHCGESCTPATVAEQHAAIDAALGDFKADKKEKNERFWKSFAAQLSTATAPQAVPLTDHHKLDNDQQVFFYEQDFYVLSNFSAFNLKFNGLTFPTSEHAYHYEKFAYERVGESVNDAFQRRNLAMSIKEAPSAHEAFKLAERWKGYRRADWDAVKVDIMREILRAKASQHEYVRRKLLETGDRELIEDSWRDDYWGWGPNRDGQNMLGKLWMEVRAGLRGITPAGTTPKEQQ